MSTSKLKSFDETKTYIFPSLEWHLGNRNGNQPTGKVHFSATLDYRRIPDSFTDYLEN